jgi:CheY-like chemotaxis protein
MTELLLEEPLTDDHRQCLETVKSATDNLLTLINDLLDFSKIEAGQMQLEPVDFSLRTLLSEALRPLTLRARQKGLSLACDVQADVPDALTGDAGRLRQVLLNLVDNAVKFTQRGEVVVRVAAAISESNERRQPFATSSAGQFVTLSFSVTDTGIGISPEKKESIFRAFEQGDASITRRFGGTGLGLSIAARLVNLMGSEIAVQSGPGQGSTFRFSPQFLEVPSHEAAVAPERMESLALPARPLRILVAEDDEFNTRHLKRLLGRRGHCVDLAGDGRQALELLGLGQLNDAPVTDSPVPAFDVLLLDLHMPELDGFQVVKRIRQCEQTSGGHLPVVAVTARSSSEDRQRCLAAGMDEHLAKPIRASELFAVIESIAAVGLPVDSATDMIDPVVLLRACGADAQGLKDLIQDLKAYAPPRLAELSAAFSGGDGPRLREVAHKLCGLLSAFSTIAGQAASDLEDLATTGELAGLQWRVAQVEQLTRELMRQLDGISLVSLQRRGHSEQGA